MSGPKVAVGAVFLVALSFWAGRLSTMPEVPPTVALGPVAASWDGGVLLQSEVNSYFAQQGDARAADPAARKEVVRSMARQGLLASVARARGIDREPAVRRQCEQSLVDALRSSLQSDEQAPEADLHAAYEAEMHRYSQEASIKLAHILMPHEGDGPKKAAALLRELTEKTKKDFYAFADAAHVQSIDGASKVAGGELPPMNEARLTAIFGSDFPALIASLEPGALLPQVVTTSRGLHVVRLLERMPASTIPFERVRDSIAARLRTERTAKTWNDFTARLEADTGFAVLAP